MHRSTSYIWHALYMAGDNMSIGGRHIIHPSLGQPVTRADPAWLTAGRVNDTVSPRSGLRVAHIQPPCAAIMDRLRASPRPIPPALVVKKGWIKRAMLVSSLPGPRSCTATIMPPRAV